jgi:hypothetical protein
LAYGTLREGDKARTRPAKLVAASPNRGELEQFQNAS